MRRATGNRHLTAEGLRAAAGAGVSSQRAVLASGLRHLGRRCLECRNVLAAYPESAFGSGPDETDDRSPGSSAPSAAPLLVELAEAEGLMAELERQPDAGRAAALVAASPRFHTYGFACTVLDAVQSALDESPGEALPWALVALVVVERLESSRYSPGSVATLRARVRIAVGGVLAGTKRDPTEAAEELAKAEEWTREATDPELVTVEAGLARARLEMALGRWDLAEARCPALDAPAREAGLTEHRVRARRLAMHAARCAGRAGEAFQMGLRLREALQASGALPAEEARVTVEIAANLVALGFADRALRELDDPGPRIAPWQERTRALRALYAGVAFRDLTRWEEAEDALQAACWGLADAGAAWESLEALLELALACVQRDARAELNEFMDQVSDLHRASGFSEGPGSLLFRVQVTAWKGELDRAAIARFRRFVAIGRPAAGPGEAAH